MVRCGSVQKQSKSRCSQTRPGPYYTNVFNHITKEDLQAIVEECLYLSIVGDCSTGPRGPIRLWDVSLITRLDALFNAAKSFNQDLSNWNVAKVTDMQGMFTDACVFNGDLSKWKVGQVKDMQCMFFGASEFNQEVSKWDVGQVADMNNMFNKTIVFNQDLSKWDVSNDAIYVPSSERIQREPISADSP